MPGWPRACSPCQADSPRAHPPKLRGILRWAPVPLRCAALCPPLDSGMSMAACPEAPEPSFLREVPSSPASTQWHQPCSFRQVEANPRKEPKNLVWRDVSLGQPSRTPRSSGLELVRVCGGGMQRDKTVVEERVGEERERERESLGGAGKHGEMRCVYVRESVGAPGRAGGGGNGVNSVDCVRTVHSGSQPPPSAGVS